MKLSSVTIENFRGYAQRTRIDIEDLTAFIGKNDAGKSTVLEALEIFFNDGKPERGDLCVHSEGQVTIRIGCSFTDLPNEIVLDAAASTSLAIEHLLNEMHELEIVKEWDASAKTPKEAIFAAASRLANELKPFFKADPKWDVFKFGLMGDNNIPINKRGSGVRRLILLNFFRAEAERRRTEKGALSVIYAIEEPETSQHPDNQRLLVQALKDLALDENTQVLVTSHTPGLAGLLPSASLRCVRKDDEGKATVSTCVDADLTVIANELGVLPDRRVQVLVFVEGPNDIEFLERLSAILKPAVPDVVDFTADNRVALVPLGGGTLKQWVANHYLKNLALREVHIYDRDDENPPQYQAECDVVNARNDGSWAVLTTKREMENYLHVDAIAEGMDVEVTFGDACDVPVIVAKAVHEKAEGAKPWAEVLADGKDLASKSGRAKKRLNREATSRMSPDRLLVSDAAGDVVGWLRRIHGMLI